MCPNLNTIKHLNLFFFVSRSRCIIISSINNISINIVDFKQGLFHTFNVPIYMKIVAISTYGETQHTYFHIEEISPSQSLVSINAYYSVRSLKIPLDVTFVCIIKAYWEDFLTGQIYCIINLKSIISWCFRAIPFNLANNPNLFCRFRNFCHTAQK